MPTKSVDIVKRLLDKLLKWSLGYFAILKLKVSGFCSSLKASAVMWGRHGALSFFLILVKVVAWRRMRFAKPRTLWGVTPIHTIRINAACDDALGLHGQSLVFVVYHIGGGFSYNFMPFLTRLREAYPRLEPHFYKLLLLYALLRFDVFHYFCDRGILPPVKARGINPLELELLRISGKRLYAYPYGGDVRVRSTTLKLGVVNLCRDCDKVGWHCICDAEEARENIENISKVATSLVSMGDMIHYMPGSHIMQFWPIEVEKQTPIPPRKFESGRPLQIVHAPNHPQFKGTAAFERALDKLKDEGFCFVYTRIQGMSNSEVMSVMKNADIVFDQLTAGFHGYTAVEGMALAKPVICFIRDRQMVPAWEECPFISATPGTIYSVLKQCMRGELDLQEIGSKGRRYAERHYSKQAVARNLADLYVETANFPNRINRRIAQKKESLEGFISAHAKMHESGPYFSQGPLGQM